MAERLKNQSLLLILERLSRLIEVKIFWPLHSSVQLFHLVITCFLLKKYFKIRFSFVTDLRLRRSVTTWSTFHALLSDLDVTLILADTATATQEKAVFEASNLIRRSFIFVGEFEIYKDSEFQQKERIEAELEPFFSVVRNVRKLSWLPPTEQPYHRYKRARSLTKINAILQSWLKANPDGSTRLLDAWLTFTARGTPPAVALTPWSRDRVESFLLKGSERMLADERYTLFLTSQAGSTSPDEQALFKNEDLRLHILLTQHERLMATGRARIVEHVEAAHLLKYADELASEVLRCKAMLKQRKALASFDVYGQRMEIFATDDVRAREILADVEVEWRFFSCEPTADDPHLKMMLRLAPQLSAPPQWPLRTALGELSMDTGRRWIRYQDQTVAALRQSEGARSIEVGLNSTAAKASLENLLHSSLGEQLEANGFVRLHAAAYRDAQGSATIHLARSGAGKSTLIGEVLKASSATVFGDETIFIRDRLAYPYPTRLALAANGQPPDRVFMGSPKVLTTIPLNRVAPPSPVGRLLFHTDAKFKLLRVAHLAVSVGLGLGLPQMKEYLIRRDSIISLAKFLRQRLMLVVSSQFEYRPANIRENVDDR